MPACRSRPRCGHAGALTMQRYVLVDASARPDTPQALRYYLQDLPHRSLFARQPEAEHADLGPWLVQLPEFGQDPIEGWLRALEQGHPAVAWLDSAGNFDAVFDHLKPAWICAVRTAHWRCCATGTDGCSSACNGF